MQERIDELVARAQDLVGIVSSAARWSAAAIAVAAVMVAAVLRFEPGIGFGWSFPGWWILALMLFVPAAIVYAYSRSSAKLADVAEGWQARLGDVADASITPTLELVDAAKETVTKRRGLITLAKGVWGMRKVASNVKDLAGDVMPAAAAFSPGYLLLTAASLLVGAAIGVAAIGLVLVRIVV